MNCTKHDTCQLYFPIPDNGGRTEPKFIIYFYPDNGEQKSVIKCEKTGDEYKCDEESGFVWKRLNSTHGLVTLPTHAAAQSGKFKSQIPYQEQSVTFKSQIPGQDPANSWNCFWRQVGSCSASYTTITSEADNNSTQPTVNVRDITKEVVIPLAFIAIVIAIALAIWMCRRKKSNKSAKGAAQDPELQHIMTDPGTLTEEHTEPQLLRIMAHPWMLTEEQLNNAKKKLLPEQAELLEQSPATLFLNGTRGTGKTTVLLLKAIEWLQNGNDVCIVSLRSTSHAVCIMLYNLLLRSINELTPNTSPKPQPYLHKYDVIFKEDVEKAVNSLFQRAKRDSLYIISDNVYHQSWQKIYSELLARVPRLHLWVAGSQIEDEPFISEVEKRFEQCLRPPPTIMKEIQQTEKISEEQATNESGCLLNDPTNSSPVRRVYHQGQDHSEESLADCSACGEEVAKILHGLIKDSGEHMTTSPPLQWRDVLMLHFALIKDNSAILEGLKNAGIPLRVMKDDDEIDIDDVAKADSDVVWVAYQGFIQGLERRVVVCLADAEPRSLIPLNSMFSYCSEVLVIVKKPL